MGFFYRKSVNLGPFRVNLSSSGVGYSVGGRGFRVGKSSQRTPNDSHLRIASALPICSGAYQCHACMAMDVRCIPLMRQKRLRHLHRFTHLK